MAPKESLVRRAVSGLKRLWYLARTERASPSQIGWAVAVGVFAGCSPAIGLHGWLAVGLATVFRLNRLYSLIGSRVSNLLFLPSIVFVEVQLAHRVRTGAWVPMRVDDAVAHAKELVVDWIVGSVPVGALLAVVLGLLAYAIALTRRRARSRRPSSESPSSGSPPPPP